MSRAQGRSVGLPKSSWFHQLPQRPIPWASSSPGATASMKTRTLWPERRTTTAPAIVPSRIPPQTPSPPFHTANGPHHASGISSQLVMSWYARAPTTPNATPQTATRRTRSQSPPRRTQRTPVRPMQAAIAASRVRPYMCTVSGPRSTVPLCGDGKEARTVTVSFYSRGPGRKARRTVHPSQARAGDTDRVGGILPVSEGRAYLEQDLQRQVGRAAALEQVHGVVEVDVVAHGEGRSRTRLEAGALEGLCSPVLDALHLGLVVQSKFGRGHVPHSLASHLMFGFSPSPVVPKRGEPARFTKP